MAMEDSYAETEDSKPYLHRKKRPACANESRNLRRESRHFPQLVRTSSISSTSSTSAVPASPRSTSSSRNSAAGRGASPAAAGGGGGASRRSRQQQQPVIIHTVDDKPIHVLAEDFRFVVQTATGNPTTRHAMMCHVVSAAACGRISTESLPSILPEIEPWTSNLTSNTIHKSKPNYKTNPNHLVDQNPNPNPILFSNPNPNPCDELLAAPFSPSAWLQNSDDPNPNSVSDLISSDCTKENTDSPASLQNYDPITSFLNNPAISISDISSDGVDDFTFNFGCFDNDSDWSYFILPA